MSEKCSYPRCRKEADLIVEGKPYCQRHYEAHLDEKEKEKIEEIRVDAGYFANLRGF